MKTSTTDVLLSYCEIWGFHSAGGGGGGDGDVGDGNDFWHHVVL